MDRLNTLIVLLAVLTASACSTHPRKLDCEAHLVPINTPPPAAPAASQVTP